MTYHQLDCLIRLNHNASIKLNLHPVNLTETFSWDIGLGYVVNSYKFVHVLLLHLKKQTTPPYSKLQVFRKSEEDFDWSSWFKSEPYVSSLKL